MEWPRLYVWGGEGERGARLNGLVKLQEGSTLTQWKSLVSIGLREMEPYL